MSYSVIKSLARRAGLYRQARWIYRHVLNRDDFRQFELERALYRPFIRPGDLCFDVGANFGFKTEVFLSLGARVVAFEPQPDCWQELKARNPSAVAVMSAVGAAPGRATMYVDRHRTGSSLLADWRPDAERTIDIAMTTLDAAIREYGSPQLCKIDVEGLELEVLQGLRQPVRLLTYEFTRRRISVAIACLDYVNALSPIEVNFTPKDTPRFTSERWLDVGEARAFLQTTVPNSTEYEWGDVFVRMQA
jgi:FkbM family methyltransferase